MYITRPPDIHTLSLHDALPICPDGDDGPRGRSRERVPSAAECALCTAPGAAAEPGSEGAGGDLRGPLGLGLHIARVDAVEEEPVNGVQEVGPTTNHRNMVWLSLPSLRRRLWQPARQEK